MARALGGRGETFHALQGTTGQERGSARATSVPGLRESASKPPRDPSGFLNPNSEIRTRRSRSKGNSRETHFSSMGRCTPSLVCEAKPVQGWVLPAVGQRAAGAGERPGRGLAHPWPPCSAGEDCFQNFLVFAVASVWACPWTQPGAGPRGSQALLLGVGGERRGAYDLPATSGRS